MNLLNVISKRNVFNIYRGVLQAVPEKDTYVLYCTHFPQNTINTHFLLILRTVPPYC